MIHPDIYVRSTTKGLGVFAKRPLLRGEILWILDDLDIKIDLKEYQGIHLEKRKKLDVYSYQDCRDRVIIAWDEGKYVNHSCNPNSTCLLEYDNISIALRDIDRGEEIVEDYSSYFNHFETFVCRCGTANCREIIEPDRYSPKVRLSLREVAPLMLSIPQVLLEADSEEIRSFKKLLKKYVKKTSKKALPTANASEPAVLSGSVFLQ